MFHWIHIKQLVIITKNFISVIRYIFCISDPKYILYKYITGISRSIVEHVSRKELDGILNRRLWWKSESDLNEC